MALTLLLFVVGFYILIKGSNVLIDGASAIAKFFNVPNILVGLLIAGIGTSIPEFAVSITSHLTGNGEVGLGTIVGSNTFNILFILGATAMFFPLVFRKEWVERDMTWNILAVAAAAFFIFSDGVITAMEGLLMLIMFAIWLFVVTKDNVKTPEDEEELGRDIAFPLAAGLVLAGIAGIFLGGYWVVDGARAMAEYFGMSRSLVGLTIVGIGTSLPELAVTFVAAFRGKPGIAVGNIIGSNIFDFLMILGVAALIKPIVVPEGFMLDVSATIGATVLLFMAMFIGAKHTLKRFQGFLFVVAYLAYIGYIIYRG